MSSARIVAAEDQLTALIASAPDDVTLDRSRILRDALRDARTRLDAVASSGTDEALATDLDGIAGELEAALATTGPTTEDRHHRTSRREVITTPVRLRGSRANLL